MGQHVYFNIDELVTLQAASRKQGRQVIEGDLSIVKDGAIVEKNGRIAWIGPTKSIPKSYGKLKRTSLKGRLVMPAFTECHTHIVFAGHRAEEFEMRAQGLSYQEIAQRGGGILHTMSSTRKASAKELKDLAQERVDRFVAQGVTTIEAKSGYALNRLGEEKILKCQSQLKQARIVSTYLGPHTVPPEFSSAKKYVTELIEKDLPQVCKAKLCNRADIFVENNYFSREVADLYLAAAKRLKMDLTVHADQLSHSGGSELGILHGAKSIDHIVHIKDDEIRALAKSNTTAVLLPTADFYLKLGYPPARKLIEAGARVALSTDFNPGSSPTQDLALVGLLARLEMRMSLPEVISAYTLAPAYALGLEDHLGSLEIGKSADFIVSESALSDFFYEAGRTPISAVYRAGQKLT